ncbi:NUDIX hydrolase [Clostridiaceae bacterium HSG29]|nr:NUDIX hydrolase [Clostridiaceae bacterium HSG29]
MKNSKIKIGKIKKTERLEYLNSFIIEYTGKDNVKRNWELVSRDKIDRLKNEILNNKSYSDGVMIFACNRERTELVILKEFRVSAGKYMYTIPAGLVDNDEKIEIAAIREFKEETGMDIEIVSIEKERYTSVGIINEKANVAYGYFSGIPSKEFQEASEDAEIEIINKDMAIDILKNQEVSMRTALLMENFFNINKFINEKNI